MTPADTLIADLDRYIWRTHLRRLVWAGLRWAAVVLGLWLALVLIEGSLWLSAPLRGVILVCFVTVAAGLLVRWLIWPAVEYARQDPEQRRLQAGRQVGAALPAVADALLNFLQLRRAQPPAGTLLAADLATRRGQLRTLPLKQLVRWRVLRRPLGVLAAVAVLMLAAAAVWPEGMAGGQQRLLTPGRAYAPPPPYSLQIEHVTNPVVQGETFELRVRPEGRLLPERLELYTNGSSIGLPLRAEAGGRFSLQMPPPERDFTVEVGTAAVRSAPIAVRVLRRPQVLGFSLELRYPAHTGLKAETLPDFTGDATLPEGTVAVWRVRYSGTLTAAQWQSAAERVALAPTATGEEGVMQLRRQIMLPTRYRVQLVGTSGLYAADSQQYELNVIPDRSPTVSMTEPSGEALLPPTGILPVVGAASDDYGLRAVWLLYRPLGAPDSSIRRKELKITPLRDVSIAEDIDWIGLGIRPGDAWELALEVADNDGVRGSKCGRSAWQRLRYGTRFDALAETEALADTAADALSAATERAEAIRQELDRMRREALEGKPMDFETQRRLAALEREQQQIRQQLQRATDQLNELAESARQQQTAAPNQLDELARVQEQLKALTTPQELEELLKSLREQERTDSRSVYKPLEKMDRTGRFQQQDLKRLKDLVERWREHQRREALAQRAEALKERQQALESLTREQQKSPEEQQRLSEQQQQLAEKARQLAEELKALSKDRQDKPTNTPPDSAKGQQNSPEKPDSSQDKGQQQQGQEAPDSSASPQELGERARQNMQQAADELQRQRPRQARPRQQQAMDQLQQLSQQLRSDEQDGALEQATENYEDLRALTENLLKLSFDQEAVQEQLQRLRPNDPSLKQKSATQTRLRADMQLVEDSLNALASRVPQIKQEVLDRTRGVTTNLEDAIEALNERQLSQTGVYQQEARTNMNALTNLLVDALSQLQMQLRAAQNRKGKPQPGAPGNLRQLAEQQQQLGDEMGSQAGDAAQAERLRQMAERQADIRRQLQEMYQRLQQQGEKGLGSLDKVGEDMDLNEADLRAAQITRQTLERQQQILSRMLDYDKAMREREYEEQRAARTAGTSGPRVGGRAPDQRPNGPGQDVLQRRRLSYSPALQQLIDRYFQALPAR